MYSLLRTFRWSTVLAVIAVALTVAAASPARDRQTQAASASTPVKPASARQWKALINKAKREGSVNFYTSHNPSTSRTSRRSSRTSTASRSS
jgi:hypothetical protein